MRVVAKFPHRVRVIEHTWITARDGCERAGQDPLRVTAGHAHPGRAHIDGQPHARSHGAAPRAVGGVAGPPVRGLEYDTTWLRHILTLR